MPDFIHETGFKDRFGTEIRGGQAVAWWCDEGSYDIGIVDKVKGVWVIVNPYYDRRRGFRCTTTVESFSPTHIAILHERTERCEH
jgi:hypothetical protein